MQRNVLRVGIGADFNIKEMLNALIKCKSAKIRLEGRQYYYTKSILSSQIKSIEETIELYKLKGVIIKLNFYGRNRDFNKIRDSNQR
jgi:hypothetical protein